MSIRIAIIAAVSAACVWTGAAAQSGEPAKTPAKAPARPVVKAEKPAAATKAVRTIDAITIEGDIAVPQVLFITSRDNRRYRDGLGKNFRMGALDVARDLKAPSRLCVAGQSGTESLKEE